MDLNLYEEHQILKDMIMLNGGCLWDLFQLIKDAADSALDFDRETINREDYEAAYKNLKRDYEFTIAEDSEKKITAEQYFEALPRL